MSIDNLARVFLFFSHFSCLIPLTIFGMIFINRRVFSRVIMLVAWSIIINVALKVTFKVPLSPTLHKVGYAFPSGHMQLATVFYGWLLLNIRDWRLCLAVPLLLLGVGFGLIHFQYHTLDEVMAGFVVAAGLIGIYSWFVRRFRSILHIIVWVSATLLLGYIAWQYKIPKHAGIAYGVISVSILIRYKHYLAKYCVRMK